MYVLTMKTGYFDKIIDRILDNIHIRHTKKVCTTLAGQQIFHEKIKNFHEFFNQFNLKSKIGKNPRFVMFLFCLNIKYK